MLLLRIHQILKAFISNRYVCISLCDFYLGPAESLFQESFYSLLKSGLKSPHGIICCQAESIWLHLNLIKRIVKFNRDIFPSVAYAFTSTPTYPSGTIGFLLSSLDKVKYRPLNSFSTGIIYLFYRTRNSMSQ